MNKYESLTLNDVSLSYIQEGEGRLLIFLHGFPDNAHTFKNQIDFFSRRGFKVIAPFMRGYYPSSISYEDQYYSLNLGQDVIEIIKHSGYEKAVLIGHDWGATAAYTAALLDPDRVDKLIIASIVRGTFSKTLISNPDQLKKSWYIYFLTLPTAEEILKHHNFALIRRLWKDFSSEEWKVPEDHIESVVKTLKQPGVIRAAVGYYRCFFDLSKLSPEEMELQKQLSTREIKTPTLYIHGSEWDSHSTELLNDMKSIFTGEFKQMMIQNCGHFMHLEKPSEFNQIIHNFI